MTVADWLAERRQNAERIARTKQGEDRQGWLEDADYFRLAELAARRLVELDHADNSPLRMYIALQVLRAWNHGPEGYCSSAVMAVNAWIDGGMKGPIPWPDSPFFSEWTARHGYSKIDGQWIGFRFTAQLTPQQGEAQRPDGRGASNISESA